MNSIFNQADFFHWHPNLNLLKKINTYIICFCLFFSTNKNRECLYNSSICVGGAVQQSTYLQTVFYKIYEN